MKRAVKRTVTETGTDAEKERVSVLLPVKKEKAVT